MGLFKKTIPMEEFWFGWFSAYHDEAQTTQEVFLILFPQFQPNTDNIYQLLESAEVSKEQLFSFKAVCCLLVQYANMNGHHSEVMLRYQGYFRTLGYESKDWLAKKGIEPDKLVADIIDHFENRETAPLTENDLRSSDRFGSVSGFPNDMQIRAMQCSYATSFLLKYCKKNLKPIYQHISRDPKALRDELMNLAATNLRLENHLLSSFKPK